jgi:hypothetical protein
MVFSQSYVKHDLRKNKIVVTSTTVFLGISTKFMIIKSIFGYTIPKELTFHP